MGRRAKLLHAQRHAADMRGQVARSREPSPVVTRFACPRCGGDHHADEHNLASTSRGLNRAQLAALRAAALEELASAILGGADAEHLRRVAAVVPAVDARLDRLAEHTEPSVQRRMLVFAESEPVAPRRGSRA